MSTKIYNALKVTGFVLALLLILIFPDAKAVHL